MPCHKNKKTFLDALAMSVLEVCDQGFQRVAFTRAYAKTIPRKLYHNVNFFCSILIGACISVFCGVYISLLSNCSFCFPSSDRVVTFQKEMVHAMI